jgi:23S rRNA pseudouridine955/2504/2580 synthase
VRISLSSKTPTNSLSRDKGVIFQEVGEHHAGQRLDNFLMARLKGVPKSRIYRIIRKGEVRVNKKREKPEYKLCSGDIIRIPPVRVAEPEMQQPPAKALIALLKSSVLYSDEELIIINKPSGLPVHGGTGVKIGLIEAMRAMLPELDYLELAHRLDKGTSGCLLLAKTGRSLKALSSQFKESSVRKTYHALVEGDWPEDIREVNAALKRLQPQGGERFVAVSREGKSAMTRFTVRERFRGATLVAAQPVTGRTHQIRVHAQLAGHPILGDEKYATEPSRKHFVDMGIRRLCLHAAELIFQHPCTGKAQHTEAPYDEAFSRALMILGQAVG